MIRTQISLTDEQADRLRAMASERGVSMASLLRDAVELITGFQTQDDLRRERALAVVGAFAAADDTGSSDHDAHLANSYRG